MKVKRDISGSKFSRINIGTLCNTLRAIGNPSIRVWCSIAQQLSDENTLAMSQTEIAKATGISSVTVSIVFQSLQQADYLQKISDGCYIVNPDIQFSGKLKDLPIVRDKYQAAKQTAEGRAEKRKAKMKAKKTSHDEKPQAEVEPMQGNVKKTEGKAETKHYDFNSVLDELVDHITMGRGEEDCPDYQLDPEYLCDYDGANFYEDDGEDYSDHIPDEEYSDEPSSTRNEPKASASAKQSTGSESDKAHYPILLKRREMDLTKEETWIKIEAKEIAPDLSDPDFNKESIPPGFPGGDYDVVAGYRESLPEEERYYNGSGGWDEKKKFDDDLWKAAWDDFHAKVEKRKKEIGLA